METFDKIPFEVEENENRNYHNKLRAMNRDLELKAMAKDRFGSDNVAGSCIGGASSSGCAPTKPWAPDVSEAKARGFRNGVHVTKQQDLVDTLQTCLEKMKALHGEYPPNRNAAIAFTQLEDCIIRLAASLTQTKRDLEYL